MRAMIGRTVPGAKETISYGISTLTLNGPLICFARFKTHISIYPMTTTIRKQFKKVLSRYLSGKVTTKFPLNQLIPYSLIGKIVTFRVKKNLGDADRTGN